MNKLFKKIFFSSIFIFAAITNLEAVNKQEKINKPLQIARVFQPKAFDISIHESSSNNKPILSESKDGSFNIELPANLSTGFQWYLYDYNRNILELLNYNYIPSEDSKKLAGAPGLAKWTFKVNSNIKGPVYTKLKLIYKRAFEKLNNQDSTEIITIFIQPK